MNKAILEFNISDPDERRSFERVVKAHNAYYALNEIKENLRNKIKYGDYTDVAQEILYQLQREFFEIISENELESEIQ